MSDNSGGEPSRTRDPRHVLVAIVIALGAVLVLGALGLSWRKEIWGWIYENGASLISVLVGGVIASLLATLMTQRYHDKPLWKKDVDRINDALGGLEERVSSLDSSVQNGTRLYRELLTQLPGALGGQFTRSLLEFYPATSASIAAILSDELHMNYLRHFQRVSVTEAADTYKVERLARVQLGDTSFVAWRLLFHATWTWYNDSRVARYPFKDFIVIGGAPDVALESYVQGRPAIDQKAERARYRAFRSGQNYVWSTVGHPSSAFLWIDDDRAIDAMFGIDEFSFETAGTKTSLSSHQLTAVSQDDRPPLAYRAFQLPPAEANVELAVGASMVVEYRGFIFIPLHRMADADVGTMVYPPSDIVTRLYQLQFVYPEEMRGSEGDVVRLVLDDEESGCDYQYSRLSGSDFANRRPTGLPQGIKVKPGDVAAVMEIDGPVTDLHRMKVVWRATP